MAYPQVAGPAWPAPPGLVSFGLIRWFGFLAAARMGAWRKYQVLAGPSLHFLGSSGPFLEAGRICAEGGRQVQAHTFGHQPIRQHLHVPRIPRCSPGLVPLSRQDSGNPTTTQTGPPQLHDPHQHRVLHLVRFKVDSVSGKAEPERHRPPRLLTLGLLDSESRLGALMFFGSATPPFTSFDPPSRCCRKLALPFRRPSEMPGPVRQNCPTGVRPSADLPHFLDTQPAD